MSRRLERLNMLLRQQLSELIRRRIKDPRLAEFVSLTRVDVAPDLETARVYVSIMGASQDKVSTMKALQSASAYLRHELTGRLVIKRVPHLQFILDESIEEGAHLLDLINSVSSREQE
ncbi:MAG TPA: 30S ribosome-binding factor RbfA [Nitrososphaera sp.]|nr:30S ribosome-binding factor RbfA [Nitrososphaera sp.]